VNALDVRHKRLPPLRACTQQTPPHVCCCCCRACGTAYDVQVQCAHATACQGAQRRDGGSKRLCAGGRAAAQSCALTGSAGTRRPPGAARIPVQCRNWANERGGAAGEFAGGPGRGRGSTACLNAAMRSTCAQRAWGRGQACMQTHQGSSPYGCTQAGGGGRGREPGSAIRPEAGRPGCLLSQPHGCFLLGGLLPQPHGHCLLIDCAAEGRWDHQYSCDRQPSAVVAEGAQELVRVAAIRVADGEARRAVGVGPPSSKQHPLRSNLLGPISHE